MLGAGDSEALPHEEVFCLKGHDGPVLAVRLNKAGTYCLSCGKVGLCDFRPSGIPSLQLCPVLKASCRLQDRSIRLWNPHRGVLIKTYAGNTIKEVQMLKNFAAAQSSLAASHV